jgi:hypothetical protein
MEEVKIQDLVDFVEEHGGSMSGEKRDLFVKMLTDWKGITGGFIKNTDRQMMDGVFDNLWSSTSPWVIRYGYGSYTENPEVVVHYWNGDNELEQKTVNAEMLHKAHSVLVQKGYKHCGQTLEVDAEEWDACGSDMVLQQAIFEEVIYG